MHEKSSGFDAVFQLTSLPEISSSSEEEKKFFFSLKVRNAFLENNDVGKKAPRQVGSLSVR